MKTKSKLFKAIVSFLIVLFLNSTLSPAYAQGLTGSLAGLPSPNQFVPLSKTCSYPVLEGLKVNPDNPFELEFIINPNGKEKVTKEEVKTLVNYFLAGLTVPQKDLWVNLSPYKKDRVAPEKLAETDLGKNFLEEDYLLKQLTSSLTYPESLLGRKYWKQLYKESYKSTGNTNIPIDTFNKIWIAPEKVKLYENKTGVLITEATLKAMLEEDILALEKAKKFQITNSKLQTNHNKQYPNSKKTIGTNQIASKVMKQVILPEIEKDINQGKNFARLRQAYHSLILAAWFKDKVKDSIYRYYIDKNKTKGIDLKDKDIKEKIYNLYAESFKKGVYDYLKAENAAKGPKQKTKRRYYSGGIGFITLGVGKGMSFDVTTGTSPINFLTSSSLSAKVNLEVLSPVSSGIKEDKGIPLLEDKSVVDKEEIARILKKADLELENFVHTVGDKYYGIWHKKERLKLTKPEIVKILAFFWENIDELKDLPVSMSFLEKVVEGDTSLSFMDSFLVFDNGANFGAANLVKEGAKPELNLDEETTLWKMLTRRCTLVKKEDVDELDFDSNSDRGMLFRFSKKVSDLIKRKIERKEDGVPLRILHFGCGVNASTLKYLKEKYGDEVELYGIGYEIDSEARENEDLILVEDNIKKMGKYFEEVEFDVVFLGDDLEWFVREGELSKVLITVMEKLADEGKFIARAYANGQALFRQSLQELGVKDIHGFAEVKNFVVVITKLQDEKGGMTAGLNVVSEKTLLETPQSQQTPNALIVISEDTYDSFFEEDETTEEGPNFAGELKAEVQKAIVTAKSKRKSSFGKGYISTIIARLNEMIAFLDTEGIESQEEYDDISELITFTELSMTKRKNQFSKIFLQQKVFQRLIKKFRSGEDKNGKNVKEIMNLSGQLLTHIKQRASSSIGKGNTGGIDATNIASEIAFGSAQFEFSPEFVGNLRGGIEGLRVKSIVLERQN